MFSELLKELRLQKKVSQTELAQAIGVSNGNVGDWERGRSKPGYVALSALARFFDVSADYLLELDPSHEKPRIDLTNYKASHGLSCDGSPLEEEEADLVAMYRLLPSHAREDMFDQLHCLYRKYAERKRESIYWTYAADKEEQKSTAVSDGGSQGGIA